MALKLIANYSKRLGLPGYSSHQFAVTVETEISNISEVAAESTRLYQTLQQSVDEEIQHTGFVPDQAYGISEQGARDGQSSGNNGNGHSNGNGQTNGNGDAWNCSEKQQDLIIKLVTEHQLDKGQLDDTSHQMFGVGVRGLNKLQASGLIDRIIADNGGRKTSRPPRNNGAPKRAYANGGAR
jgi:hypothetical protein